MISFGSRAVAGGIDWATTPGAGPAAGDAKEAET
jgi:hypothetical protein